MLLSHNDWNSLLRDVASDPSDTPYLILGGFQRIKLLTAIPLRSLTLLYGPNSGGKGSIVDALRLLRSLHQEELEEDRKALLRRWHRREAGMPLTVGFSITISAHQWWSAAKALPEAIADAAQEKIRIIWEASWLDASLPEEINLRLYASQDLLAEFAKNGGKHILKIDNKLFGSLFGVSEGSELGLHAHNSNYLPGYKTNQDFTELPILVRGSLSDYAKYTNNNQGPSDDYYMGGLFSTPLDLIINAAGMSCELAHIGPLRRIPKPKDLEFRVSRGWGFATTMAESRQEMNGDGGESWRALATAVAREAMGVESNHDDEGVLSAINRWLLQPDFLDTGYQLVAEVCTIQPIGQSTHDLKLSMAECIKKNNPDLIVKISLLDTAKRNVEFRDVGTGFSQLIPVLISCVVRRGVAFIEQPELHLHPRMQGKICDLLLEAKNKHRNYIGEYTDEYRDIPVHGEDPTDFAAQKAYEIHLAMKWHILLVESHSEHILLRLMKRIRESAEADIQHRRFAVSPSDVSVLYFEPEGDQTFVHLLRLTEDGEFADRWPHGFFDERYQDLFDE